MQIDSWLAGEMWRKARYLLFVVGFFVTGCFADVQTVPSTKTQVFNVPPPAGSTVLGIALSGGGSRAAYFGAAGLKALSGVRTIAEPQALLERVSYLSSVSGGSLTSSYFAMKKPERDVHVLTHDGSLTADYSKFFQTYLDTMASNIEYPVIWKQFYKIRWGHSNQRATSLAEVLDDKFLDGATFQDLYEREKAGHAPRLIVNATFYNNGRRAAMTTLPSTAFNYDFIGQLQTELKKSALPGVSVPPLPPSLANAQQALIPQTFADLGIDTRVIPLSRAVAASASFPPLIGPITIQIKDDEKKVYHHVGDGGLFDNQGTESLVQLLLKMKAEKQIDRALIIAFDSSFPFTGKVDQLNHMENGFDIFLDDPGRIVGIMEVRANAYQSALWHTLQAKNIVVPDDQAFKVIVIKHTDDVWPENWRGLVPSQCAEEQSGWKDKKDLIQHLALVPTRFKIDSTCDRALLDKVAQLAVERNQDDILGFLRGQER